MFLTATDVVKDYAGHRALDGLNIEVPEGSIYGLLGPNGAGKTTFIRILNQITQPDSGEVTLNGKPLCRADISQIGYLPEERGLYKKMRVGEEALYLAQLKGLTRQEAKSRLTEWFERMDIMPWWDKKVEELSKGMQQKVQFICTVLHRPRLLIFDEPFSGFDPVNAQVLKEEILRLRAEGATILFSTHNMASVEEMCDSITLINNARAILSGNVGDIRRQFKQNIFSISVDGDTTPLTMPDSLVTVSDSQTRGGLTQMSVRANDANMTPRELISHLSERVNLVGFQEMLPSMNDIFIKLVTENKTQK